MKTNYPSLSRIYTLINITMRKILFLFVMTLCVTFLKATPTDTVQVTISNNNYTGRLVDAISIVGEFDFSGTSDDSLYMCSVQFHNVSSLTGSFSQNKVDNASVYYTTDSTTHYCDHMIGNATISLSNDIYTIAMSFVGRDSILYQINMQFHYPIATYTQVMSGTDIKIDYSLLDEPYIDGYYRFKIQFSDSNDSNIILKANILTRDSSSIDGTYNENDLYNESWYEYDGIGIYEKNTSNLLYNPYSTNFTITTVNDTISLIGTLLCYGDILLNLNATGIVEYDSIFVAADTAYSRVNSNDKYKIYVSDNYFEFKFIINLNHGDSDIVSNRTYTLSDMDSINSWLYISSEYGIINFTSCNITRNANGDISVIAKDNNRHCFIISAIEKAKRKSKKARKVLLEYFDTSWDNDCESACRRIEDAIEKDNIENDVIWVTHHSCANIQDDLTKNVDLTLESAFSVNTTNVVMVDRTNLSSSYLSSRYFEITVPYYFPRDDMDEVLDYALSQTTFVSVNFSSLVYDSVTRQLTTTISGEVTGHINATDLRLNVWLMEDSLVADGGTTPGHGPTQSGSDNTFKHNHVIRQLLSSNDWGDDSVVVNLANTTYYKSYTCTVSPDYIDKHCYLVAFISEGNHSDRNNCKVYNSEKTAFITDTNYTDTIPYHNNSNIMVSHQGASLDDGDTICVGVDKNEPADIYVGYSNRSYSAITMRIHRSQEIVISGETETFSIGTTPYGGNTSGDILLAGNSQVPETDKSKALHISFISSSEGDAVTRYCLQNEADSTDNITFYVSYKVSGTSGLEIGTETNDMVSVYPNPAKEVVIVNGIEMNNTLYVIYSLSGQKVASGKSNGYISVGGIPSSTYILEIWANERIYRVKIIIE